jgi:hypothetical protein
VERDKGVSIMNYALEILKEKLDDKRCLLNSDLMTDAKAIDVIKSKIEDLERAISMLEA